MTRAPRLHRLARWLSGGGCLILSGCLTAASRNLDLLLSPEAYDNISPVPYSAVNGLVEWLAHLGR